ncbi:MAG: DUF935 family protein [Bacteroidota bacterium]
MLHLLAGRREQRAGSSKSPWSIEPFDESATSQQRAEWLTQVITQLKPRRLFKRILESRLMLFSVMDFEMEVVDQLLTPLSFTWYEPHFFRYQNGVLGIDHGTRWEPLPDEALVCEADEQPVMLPVLRDYILKEFGIEAWASFMEDWGDAFLIGEYPMGASPEFKKALNDGLRDLGISKRGSVPQGGAVKVVESGKGTASHQSFKAECDAGISIALLGHRNAVQQSPGSMQIGENSSAFKVREEVADDDVGFVDECMADFIRILWRLNFADGTEPTFRLFVPQRVDREDLRRSMDMAYRHGVTLEPENYRRLGLLIPEGQEAVTRPADLLNFD